MPPRVLQPELMDNPALAPAAHEQALRGLSRLNALIRAAGLIWNGLRDLLRRDQPLRVLDLATGSGDIPLALWRQARRARLPLTIAGCDKSPRAIDLARQCAAEANADVAFFTHDVLADPLPGDYDVVCCSLLLHHLTENDGAQLLRAMAGAARRRVLVSDIRRGRANTALVWLAAHLVSRSPVMHVDAVRSIRAAYTVEEVRQLARRAGLQGANVRRRPLCRLLLEWDKA